MDPPPVPEPAAQAAAKEARTGSAVTNGIVDAAPGEASGSVAAANPELSISHVTAEAKRPEEPNEADSSPEAAEEAIADAPAESRAEEHAAPDDASAQPSLMDVEPPADSQPALKSETTVDALEAPEAANNPAPASPSSEDVGALFDLEAPASVEVYDMSNYTFGKKELEARGYLMRLESARAQESHLKTRYGERGQRRSVAGVLLVHSHRFPLLLLLQRADGRGPYALPGGRLRLGESAEAGLARKLRKHLTPEGGDEDAPELDIGERRTWFRKLKINFLSQRACRLTLFPLFSSQ